MSNFETFHFRGMFALLITPRQGSLCNSDEGEVNGSLPLIFAFSYRNLLSMRHIKNKIICIFCFLHILVFLGLYE